MPAVPGQGPGSRNAAAASPVGARAHSQAPAKMGSAMKTIGLLGGMSWESSIVYEQIINQEVRRRLGGLHSADLLIRSYDFAVVERMQVAGAWEQAGRLLAADARRLEGAGAHLLVLCTNTMHQVYDTIAAAVSIPLLHIADATTAAAPRPGRRRGHRR